MRAEDGKKEYNFCLAAIGRYGPVRACALFDDECGGERTGWNA